MRAVKFRAWHKQEKKMYEVNVIRFGVQHGMARGDLADYVDLDSKSRSYIVGDDIDLMQFTGLLDAKGNEIYEGDILEIEGATAKVVFWGRPPGFGLDYYHDEGAWCDDWNLTDDNDRMTIIGNIYEDEDLLKK